MAFFPIGIRVAFGGGLDLRVSRDLLPVPPHALLLLGSATSFGVRNWMSMWPFSSPAGHGCVESLLFA